MEYFILWVVIGAIGGAIIGHFKGRIGEGAAFGAFLGFIGWLLLLLSPDTRRKCPACKGPIPEDATKCMHCGDAIPAPARAARVVQTEPLPVIEYWKEIVPCPVCGDQNLVAAEDLSKGLKCKACGVGFVPKPMKV